MNVYILTGMPGSGKEEFVETAREKGFKVVSMGDVVREEASKRGINPDDKGIGGFAHSERQTHGYGIWAERTLAHIGDQHTLISGCRGWSEVEIFKRSLGDKAIVIALHSSPKTRFERLMKRGRSDAPKTLEEFRTRDERELSWGLGSLIALADVMIVNEGLLDDLKKKVEETLEELD